MYCRRRGTHNVRDTAAWRELEQSIRSASSSSGSGADGTAATTAAVTRAARRVRYAWGATYGMSRASLQALVRVHRDHSRASVLSHMRQCTLTAVGMRVLL